MGRRGRGTDQFVLAGALASLGPRGCALAEMLLSAIAEPRDPLPPRSPGPPVPIGLAPAPGTYPMADPPALPMHRFVMISLAMTRAADMKASALDRMAAVIGLIFLEGHAERALGAWLLLSMAKDATTAVEHRHEAEVALSSTKRPRESALAVELLVGQARDRTLKTELRIMAATAVSITGPHGAAQAASGYWAIMLDRGADYVGRRTAGVMLDKLGPAQFAWATRALLEVIDAPGTDDVTRVIAAAGLCYRKRGIPRDRAIAVLRRIAADPHASGRARAVARDTLAVIRPWWKRVLRGG